MDDITSGRNDFVTASLSVSSHIPVSQVSPTFHFGAISVWKAIIASEIRI